jgi:hypothetical protein
MGRATARAAALPASENREKEQAHGGIGGDPVLRMVESRVRALEQWEDDGSAVDSESTARVSSIPRLVTLVALSCAAFSRRARRGSRSRVLPDPHRTLIALTTSAASSGEMTPAPMARTVAASEAAASPASFPTARSSTVRRRQKAHETEAQEAGIAAVERVLDHRARQPCRPPSEQRLDGQRRLVARAARTAGWIAGLPCPERPELREEALHLVDIGKPEAVFSVKEISDLVFMSRRIGHDWTQMLHGVPQDRSSGERV